MKETQVFTSKPCPQRLQRVRKTVRPQRPLIHRPLTAKYYEALAARIRSGESISVGGETATVGDRVELETELEPEDGKTELEIEIKWAAKEPTSTPLVGILTGSPSDTDVVDKARRALEEMGVPCEVQVLSAHRTPDLTLEYVRSAEERGFEVLIACAGMAAHLAGVVAANSPLPVIGVPLSAGSLLGFDALLSTVQMPSGVPVATVAVDGARNSAFLAARILARKYPELGDRLQAASAAGNERYEELARSR